MSAHTRDNPPGLRYGLASFYGWRFHGRMMADGHRFHALAATAASRDYPLGTWLRIRNPANGRTCRARVTDRGPVPRERLLDVSLAVARCLGMVRAGLAYVMVEQVR